MTQDLVTGSFINISPEDTADIVTAMTKATTKTDKTRRYTYNQRKIALVQRHSPDTQVITLLISGGQEGLEEWLQSFKAKTLSTTLQCALLNAKTLYIEDNMLLAKGRPEQPGSPRWFIPAGPMRDYLKYLHEHMNTWERQNSPPWRASTFWGHIYNRWPEV